MKDTMREIILKLIYLYESDPVKSQTMRSEISVLYILLANEPVYTGGGGGVWRGEEMEDNSANN